MKNGGKNKSVAFIILFSVYELYYIFIKFSASLTVIYMFLSPV